MKPFSEGEPGSHREGCFVLIKALGRVFKFEDCAKALGTFVGGYNKQNKTNWIIGCWSEAVFFQGGKVLKV